MKKIFTILSVGLISLTTTAQTALDFEESEVDHVLITNSFNGVLTGTNTITVEAWVKLESYSFLPTIIGDYGFGDFNFLLRIDGDKPTFHIGTGGIFTPAQATTTMPLDTWTHVAGVWDGTDIKIYVNGVLENTVAKGGNFDTSGYPVKIGGSYVSEDMDGLIDNLRVWSTVRTATDINDNMNICMDGSEVGLIALYNFEEGIGTIVNDITGNGYDGTLTNSPEWVTGIDDVIAPVADAANLADVTETCQVASLAEPTATDNCAFTVTVTNDATFPITTIGTTVVTWTFDDGNGNTSTQTQNVTVIDPMIDITTATANFVITANNSSATSYQWIDCNNSNAAINGETNATYTALANGDYAVIVTEGDCSDTSDCVTIAGVGINERADLNVSIYPNPNNGEFYVSSSENDVMITIYALDGKVVLNTLKVTETNQLINLEEVQSGVYFVQISNDINQKVVRLIIE